MKRREIKIKKYKFVEFPKPEYFAESFVIQDDVIYFPLNSIGFGAALYAYKKHRFKKLFEFRKDEIIKKFESSIITKQTNIDLEVCFFIYDANYYYFINFSKKLLHRY